jgi:hypothetical protein
MIQQLFYCLPSGQFFGSWVGDPGIDRNELAERGYVEVPAAPESTAYFWGAEQQAFYLPPSAETEREWRDAELVEMMALRDRHRDQLEIGGDTTLTAEQYTELLVYMQALRDWPQSDDFPEPAHRPQAPAWVAGAIQ